MVSFRNVLIATCPDSPYHLSVSDPAQFHDRLKLHQRGGTDYPTFCADARAAGVQRWVVDTQAMTCTYYSAADEVVLVEAIPLP